LLLRASSTGDWLSFGIGLIEYRVKPGQIPENGKYYIISLWGIYQYFYENASSRVRVLSATIDSS
jgi:hypothetical protein